MRVLLAAAALALGLTIGNSGVFAAAGREAVIGTYADIAHAMYGDAYEAAEKLQAAVTALTANPSAGTLASAREAWVAARVPYQQTEALCVLNTADMTKG